MARSDGPHAPAATRGGRVPRRILRGKLPRDSFRLGGRPYRLDRVLKQDFFAATGRYVGPDGERVVLKHYHTDPFLGLPLDWAGRWMADREVRHYRALQDLEGVPRLLGRVGASAFVHEWVEGKDLLDRREPVPDDFFDRLDGLLAAVHARGMAYVDANKPDNVLVAARDGRPVLIDFQISWMPKRRGDRRGDARGRSGLGPIRRPILAALQREDRYHFRKLKRRFRPDLMTPEEHEASRRRSGLLSLHRLVAAPLRDLRRWVLDRLGAR